ncbi:hypothetical protein ACQ4PT_037644 [Festuca glaucescens]
MESSQRNGLRTPFQDLTNTGNAVQRPDPKELKRQQERERYARNKDEINKKWRESREQKKATSAILKENQTPSKTSLAISLGIPTVTVPSGATPFDGQNSLQSKQTASSNKENLHCDYYAIGSSRGCGLQPPNQALSSLEDKQALKRERENLRYELNKDVILQRLRETCHRKKAKCVLTSGEHTQLDTPVSNICATGLYTGKSAVIQLHQTPNIEDITTAGLQSFAPPIEQPIADEDCDWLHRNDTYQMQKIGGRMRPVNIPNAKPYIDTPMEKYIGNDHGEDAYGILEYLGSPLDYQTGYYINDCLDTLQHGEAEHPEPDEEARIFIEQDVAFESYQLGCHPSRATPVADTEEFQKQAFDLPTYDNLIREEQFMNFAPHKDQATGLPADNNTMQEPVGNDARHEDHATDLPEDDNEDNPDEDFGDNEVNATQSRKFVSAREYYCFKLQVRKKLFNIILFGGRLFQQWAVDMYIKIETMRLDWYSKPENQKVIRADLYQGLVDTIVAGESHGDRIGKRIVLPHTFPGGDRDMQRRFLDAMAIVQRWGKPDYFITMTCNPYWEEITEKMMPGQLQQDRPDLVARVFKAKQ